MIKEKYDWLGLVMLFIVGVSVGMTIGFSNKTVKKDESLYYRIWGIEQQMEKQHKREIPIIMPLFDQKTNQTKNYHFFVLGNETPFGL